VTAADLKKLNISGPSTLAKMIRWGWCDDAGREIHSSRWTNKRNLADIGRSGVAGAAR
jgi:hypothetical protein